LIRKGFPAHFPFHPKRRVLKARILNLVHLEFHQLDRRWATLRVRDPLRQRRLLASLAEGGQQTPIIVVQTNDCYLVIDGHKRIAALEAAWPRYGRRRCLADERSRRLAAVTIDALRSPGKRTGTRLVAIGELEQHFHYSLDELSRRFDRSTSWVSRRLGLVDLLPEAIQQHVRDGRISAQLAMKFLVPVARVDADDFLRLATIFIEQHCDSRAAQQLYTAWRKGTRTVRDRILAEPELFLKTQRPTAPTVTPAAEQVLRDLEMALAILRRANKQLTEAMSGMNTGQHKQTQYTIESARRELNRMSERIQTEQEPKHAEPGTANHDSGTPRPESEPARDCACHETLAPERAAAQCLLRLARASKIDCAVGLNPPNRRIRDPYVRWCNRESWRQPTYVNFSLWADQEKARTPRFLGQSNNQAQDYGRAECAPVNS